MFKAPKFYLYQIFTFSLLFNLTLAQSNIPNREMIILLETTNAENINHTLQAPSEYSFQKIMHPTGLTAMTMTLLIALYQKAAPIIANKSLIKNIVDHQNLFSHFLHLDLNSLYNLYGHYNRFKGPRVLENFKTNCLYITKSLSEINKKLTQISPKDLKNQDAIIKELEKIAQNPPFNFQSLPTHMKELNKDIDKIQGLQMEMIIYILSNRINFNDWQIKQVNDDIFLFIPKDYIKNLKINTSKGQKPSQAFTDLELELGLKVEHMRTIGRNFFEQPTYQFYQEIPFVKSLEQIFITNSELKKYKLTQNKNIWSMHMAGHGFSKCPQLEILPQLYELKKLFEKQLKAAQADIKVKNNRNAHATYTKYLHKLNKLNNEIRRIESFIHSSNDKRDHGLIASLPINEFREILKFFNDEIEMAIFHYTSCFAGGSHLIAPYIEIDKNGKEKALTFKYPIICGCPAENTSLLEYPFMNLPPYQSSSNSTTNCSPLDIKNINFKNKRLKLHTTLKFKKFFAAAKKGIQNNKEKLLLACHCLHPFTTNSYAINDFIANIPLVRMAHSDYFEPIQRDNSYTILNAQNSSRPITINKEATLIYSDYIQGKLTLNKSGEKQNIPHLISMIPGFALHTFENISSSTLNFNEVINSFLTFPELGSSKIFWIKKLECKNENQSKEIFNDVIITRNVFNSDTLARCNGRPTRLENCAYFSKNDHKTEKLSWDGPFISDNNFKVNPWNNNDHKKECLHNFPKLANLVNPVLQSI